MSIEEVKRKAEEYKKLAEAIVFCALPREGPMYDDENEYCPIVKEYGLEKAAELLKAETKVDKDDKRYWQCPFCGEKMVRFRMRRHLIKSHIAELMVLIQMVREGVKTDGEVQG